MTARMAEDMFFKAQAIGITTVSQLEKTFEANNIKTSAEKIAFINREYERRPGICLYGRKI